VLLKSLGIGHSLNENAQRIGIGHTLNGMGASGLFSFFNVLHL
jgi:hypothetical protein